MAAQGLDSIPKKGKGVSGLLLPAVALGWWGRQALVQEAWIWDDAVRRVGGVSGGETGSSPLWDNTEQIQLSRSLCARASLKFLLTALVMKYLVSSITVLYAI